VATPSCSKRPSSVNCSVADSGSSPLVDTLFRRGGTKVSSSPPPSARRAVPESTRVYDLRHTFTTLLLARNVHPKYVQELLGHASIALTLDTYSHVLPGMDGAAASAMDEALG
jgi:integrase